MLNPLRVFARTVLALFLIVACPDGARGQTILNTERFQLQSVDGSHARIDASLSGREGNRRLWVADASGIVGHLTGDHWVRLIFGANYLISDEASLLDARFAQLRYSRRFTAQTQSFHFVQAQRNETLRLRQRWLVGSGVQREFSSGAKQSLSLGTGLMMEWESLDADAVEPGESTETRRLRLANLVVAKYAFDSGAELLNVLYLQPDVQEFSSFRVLNDLGVQLPISGSLRVSVTGSWRRDTRPPSQLSKDDLTLRVGLALTVR
jgi:hypothetical protein